jgi:O-antigen ligase
VIPVQALSRMATIVQHTVPRHNALQSTTRRPGGFAPYLGGSLTAIYLLIGRWSFERLQHVADQDFFDTPTSQLRHYILLALIFVTVVGVPVRRRTTSARCLRPPQLVPLWLTFFLYVSSTALWSPIGAQTSLKVLDMGSLAVLTLCVASWTAGEARTSYQKAFWLTFCATVAALIGFTVAGYGFTDEQRIAFLGGGPNVFGRNMAIGFLGSLFLIRYRLGRYWIAITVLTPLMVLMSGSRGALAALICAASAYFVAERVVLRRRLAMVTAILCVGGAVLFYSDLGERSLSTYQERILRLTVQERYDSERTDLVQTAYAMVLTHPVFGAGLASFPLYSTGFYAHNIFLETVSETGGVGVCLLLLPLIAFVVFSVRHWSLVDRPTVCAFVAALVHAQFSGDLFDSRAVFVLLIMASSIVVVKPGTSQGNRHKTATMRCVGTEADLAPAMAGLGAHQ